MPAAPKPENEKERLEKLYSYDILDTLPEQRFDDLATLAAKTLGRPIALISFVDKDRQWLKARYGLDVDETPRAHAFCAYTVLDHATFIVEDALSHPRVSDNPLVTGDPNIRFYAGAPIITSDNHALGSLCVIDREPGSMSDEEIEILEGFARQVAVQLEYTRALKDISEMNGRLLYEQKQSRAAKVAKSQFLANLSHELRTPMNAIMGFTDRLRKRLKDAISERDMDSLDTVSRNANNLLEMINRLIDVSRLEAGAISMHKQKVPFSALLQQLQENFNTDSGKVSLEISSHADNGNYVLDADIDVLVKSIEQLASNVMNASSDTVLHLEVCPELKEGPLLWLALSIRSKGSSSLGDEHAISRADYEASEKDVNQSLATMIAQEQVELHDGQIQIRRSNEKTLEFIVHLPARKASVDSIESRPSTKPDSVNPTILCIDDDSDTLKYLQLTLEDEGYSVVLALNHDHAVELYQRELPDLICLDLCMPGKDGYEVVRTLSERHGELKIPIVVVTSSGEVEEAFFSSLHTVIQKPVSSEDLLAEVKSALAIGDKLSSAS